MMGFKYDQLNYYDNSADLDIVSWDNYMRMQWGMQEAVDPTRAALSHDTMRGLKKKNFWVMEQQSGSGGWEYVAASPKPGELRLWTHQSIAHGADAIVYFRWRTARVGTEQYWHGILDHHGIPGRRYAEVCQVGEELHKISEVVAGSQNKPMVAIMQSYDTRFAFQVQPNNPRFSYEQHIQDFYRGFFNNNISVDIVSEKDPLDGYKVVIVPSMYILTEDTAATLEKFAAEGGIVVFTPRTGVKDESNTIVNMKLPGLAAKMCGIEIEEYISMPVDEDNRVRFGIPELEDEFPTSVWADVIEPNGAKVVAWHTQGFYAEKPAATINQFKKGKVIYLGTFGDATYYDEIARWISGLAGIEPLLQSPEGVEVAARWKGDQRLLFVLNHTNEAKKISLDDEYTDLLTGITHKGDANLDAFGVLVLTREQVEETMKVSYIRAILLMITMLVLPVGCGPTQTVEPTTSQEPTEIASSLVAISPESISLSGDWRFSVDRNLVGEKQGWFASDFDDSSWESVSVPHTWNVMPKYLDYEGLGWYRRTFTVPAGAGKPHLRLHFEAAFYVARVWLNGQFIGQHEGGYTSFEFDVSAVAKPGETNSLAVQVDNLRSTSRIPAQLNPQWSFDWYNYGGIIRDVSLEITSQAYIAKQQIVSTPHLIGLDEADSAIVTATLTILNTSGEQLAGSIKANILDDNSGKTVLEALITMPVNIPAGTSGEVKLSVTIPNPKLWHFDHPNLYRWSTSLIASDGVVLDTDTITIGIRTVELKNGYFYLNGEPVRLVGVSRHEDYPGQGSAETLTAMAADYNDLKLLNEVLTRPVHYPQNQYILDYADRHGILLIPEIPAWQLTQQQMNSEQMQDLEKQQLCEMVAADANHPSVFAWSIANEIESDTFAGKEFVKKMIAYVKSLDPTRPVGFASNRLYSNPQMDATALSDFVMMNQYFGTWGGPKKGLDSALDLIHKTWPEKTIIISEFGFEPHWNELWGPSTSTLNTEQYYFIPDGTRSDSEAADIVRQQLIIEQMAIYRSKPFVAGTIFWTYQDYRTRSNFIMGLVDFQRNQRGSWQILRNEYTPVIIDGITLSPMSEEQSKETVSIHTRGPIDVDMPVYTLRGYRLHWEVTSPDRKMLFSQGDVSLPTLAPTTQWTGEIKFPVPSQEYIIELSIIRPTGTSVIERSFDALGGQLP